MAISRYQEAHRVTREDYDAVNQRLNFPADAPGGLLYHAVAPMEGGGMRFWEVWESEDQMRRFDEERLMPVLREMFDEPGEPPREEIAEVHFVWSRGG